MHGLGVLVIGAGLLAGALFVIRKPHAVRLVDQAEHDLRHNKRDLKKIEGQLARLGPKKYEALAGLMQNDDPWVSLGAIEILKNSEEPAATEVLMSGLEQEHSGWAAARALGARKSKRAVPLIVEALRGSTSGTPFRADAAIALGQIGDPRGIAGLLIILQTRRPSGPSWIKASAINENTARIRAIGALYRLDPASEFAKERFREMEQYLRSPFGNLKPIVFAELGHIDRPESIPMLVEGLKDSDGVVRAAAVRSLAKKELPDISKTLAPLMTDKDPVVRVAVKRALESGK